MNDFQGAWATEYYISMNGSDWNPRSPGNPFRTRLATVDVSSARHTNFIHKGSCHEELLIERKGETKAGP